MTLPAFAAERRRPQINVSILQQTRRPLLLPSIDETDGQTDRQTDGLLGT